MSCLESLLNRLQPLAVAEKPLREDLQCCSCLEQVEAGGVAALLGFAEAEEVCGVLACPLWWLSVADRGEQRRLVECWGHKAAASGGRSRPSCSVLACRPGQWRTSTANPLSGWSGAPFVLPVILYPPLRAQMHQAPLIVVRPFVLLNLRSRQCCYSKPPFSGGRRINHPLKKMIIIIKNNQPTCQ